MCSLQKENQNTLKQVEINPKKKRRNCLFKILPAMSLIHNFSIFIKIYKKMRFMRAFLLNYRFFFIGFSSIIKTEQNQLNFEKHDIKKRLLESSIKIKVKAHSGELKM